ncbi:MAG TPA: hypothetical protein VM939_11135 [Gemmatimonadaceae bacterium]|nr:hypothetical protein [Gemmatimonadaceae bacterium]
MARAHRDDPPNLRIRTGATGNDFAVLRKTFITGVYMSRVFRSMSRLARTGAALAAITAASCLTISDPPEGLSVLSIMAGNNQNVAVNTLAPAALVVQALDHRASPMAGQEVLWTITSGSGVLSGSSSVTDESGFSSIRFTGGNTVGPVQVRAEAGGLRVTFTVTVSATLP